jgi:hypothetical protein
LDKTAANVVAVPDFRAAGNPPVRSSRISLIRRLQGKRKGSDCPTDIVMNSRIEYNKGITLTGYRMMKRIGFRQRQKKRLSLR